METKHMSLQSQTVRCHHCGEYYSVTYKFCPFCDAARQEEERRVAEKKKQRQAMLGGFLNGQEAERKKSDGGDHGRRSGGEAASRKAPAKKEAPRQSASRQSAPKTREPLPPPPPRQEPRSLETPEKETGKVTPFYRKDGRKKTSEMTPEERAAHLAQREARAAERKRAREQAAREAARAAGTGSGGSNTAGDPTPVFEDDTLPETFGLVTNPDPGVDENIFDQISSHEGKDTKQLEDVMEVIPLYLTPDGLQKEAPAAEPAQPQAEADASRAFLQDMAQEPEDSMVLVMGQPEAIVPGEETLVVQTADQEMAEPAQPVSQQGPEAVLEPAPADEQPAAPAGGPQVTASQGNPAPASQPEMTKSLETSEELDSLLSEIRDMLAESPVPDLAAEQQKTPPKAAAQVEIPQPAVSEKAPVPVEQPAAGSEAVESPTIVLPTEEIAKAAEETKETPAAPEVAVDDSPTQVIPRQQIQEMKEEGPDILPAVAIAAQGGQETQESGHQGTEAGKTSASVKPPRKTRQRGGISPLLLILSLILIAAAVFIVIKTVVPAFQDGLFSQGQEKEPPADTAATFTLEKTEMTVAEEGQTFTLTPIFEPEGSTATLTWTSSDEAVATVDETGLVSAIAPGTATITAAMASGYSAQCVVTCNWSAQSGEGEAGAEAEAAAGPALSASTMTLNEVGAAKQLQVTGAAGAVTWTSSAPEVATVADDGTVTAVSKGGASVTAEVDGTTLTCEIKCIW